MTTKTVDSRGRLTLGPDFANRLVIVRRRRGGIVEIIPAEAVPAREAWLFKNPQALRAVTEGLEQTSQGQFAESPDLDADADWADAEDED
jgi:hypothetical protein